MRQNEIIRNYLRQRSDEAFGHIVKLYTPLVFSTSLRKMGDEESSKDVTQQVFIDFHNKVEELLTHPNIAGWFYQATLFRASNYLRKKVRDQKRLEKMQQINECNEETNVIWLNRIQSELDDLIQEIPEKLRLAIIQHYLLGNTVSESSRELNISEAALRKRLARARKLMQDILSQKYTGVTSSIFLSVLGSSELRSAPKELMSQIIVSHTPEISSTISISGVIMALSASKKLMAVSILILLSVAFTLGLIINKNRETPQQLDKQVANTKTASKPKPEPLTQNHVSVSGKNIRRIQLLEEVHDEEPPDEYEENPAANQDAIEREMQYAHVQALTLAQTLAEKYNGTSGRCLVIHPPLTNEGSQQHIDRTMNSFEEGFDDRIVEIRSAAIKDLGNEVSDMDESLYDNSAEDFNKIIDANKDCDIIIMLTPLPAKKNEIKKIKIFTTIEDEANPNIQIKDPGIDYPLVGVFNGYIGNMTELLESDLIGAMTMWKPKPIIDGEPVPEVVQEAFDKRYTLISNENLLEHKEEYPELFPSETTE